MIAQKTFLSRPKLGILRAVIRTEIGLIVIPWWNNIKVVSEGLFWHKGSMTHNVSVHDKSRVFVTNNKDENKIIGRVNAAGQIGKAHLGGYSPHLSQIWQFR